MGSPVNYFFPDPEQTGKAAAVNLLFRFGMSKGRPFTPSNEIGDNGNPTFSEIKDYEGIPWITTLALMYVNEEKKISMRFEFLEVIATINQEKNIVTTAMQGRNGTIKEYISDGDYSITLDCGINNYTEGDDTGASFEYPKDKIEELYKILSLPETLIVSSPFLSMFRIDSAVVKSYSLQQETHSNRQYIQIQMLSDRAYEIDLKDKKDVEAKK
ncbi:MAG: hypothetical protein E2590_12835 [Chryseobacterium sp.]|nr:hypothetical protein [Chryseobacterium sp.]